MMVNFIEMMIVLVVSMELMYETENGFWAITLLTSFSLGLSNFLHDLSLLLLCFWLSD